MALKKSFEIREPCVDRVAPRTSAQLMTDSFATLNPDLLHLCLLHLERDESAYARAGYGRHAHTLSGKAVARAGATCKHWRAVASTERLWREICVKRWPSTAKLPRAPASHLEFYKQRTGRNFCTPTIALNRLTLLFDGQFGGRFSEVLSFADATPCEFQPYGTTESFRGFEWSVPAMDELLQAEEDYSNLDFDADILRDDGKIAAAGRFEWVDCTDGTVDGTNPKYKWTSGALDLEFRSEFVTRVRENWFHLHAEYSDGKLKVCASNRLDDDQEYVDLSHALALLDWV